MRFDAGLDLAEEIRDGKIQRIHDILEIEHTFVVELNIGNRGKKRNQEWFLAFIHKIIF